MENHAIEVDQESTAFDQELAHAIEELAQQNVLQCAPQTVYSDVLNQHTVVKLRTFARIVAAKGASKMAKAQLVETIANSENLPAVLDVSLMATDLDGWELFCRAVQVDHMPCQAASVIILCGLQNCGVVQCFYHEGIYYAVVPDRIKQAYATLVNGGFLPRKNRNIRLRDYLAATTNLYGVISIADFVEIYNTRSMDTTSTEEVLQVVELSKAEEAIVVRDGYLINSLLAENGEEEYKTLLAGVSTKPRYLPDTETLLRYADPDYYEKNNHTEMLVAYLKQIVADETEAEEIADTICIACAQEYAPDELFGILEDFDVELQNNAQVEVMGNVFIDLCNHTRIWYNNGHTADEINKMMEPEAPVAPKNPKNPQQVFSNKVGRNDPCPCGSGKKFKKCCGR